jgi:hypothetical protein
MARGVAKRRFDVFFDWRNTDDAHLSGASAANVLRTKRMKIRH